MTAQRSLDHVGLPRPHQLDLIDAGRAVGWISGDTVGFRGFADETEAAHAAWAAFRTISRRLAPRHGARPIPIATEPLTLQRRGDQELVLASGRQIAVLVRPGPESRSGPDTFGFEIRIPAPGDELQVRAMAYFVYRTLRRSGIRWSMWRPAAARAAVVATNERSGAGARGFADGPAYNENGGGSNDTERPDQRVRRVPAWPWRRASPAGRRPGDRAHRLRQR